MLLLLSSFLFLVLLHSKVFSAYLNSVVSAPTPSLDEGDDLELNISPEVDDSVAVGVAPSFEGKSLSFNRYSSQLENDTEGMSAIHFKNLCSLS